MDEYEKLEEELQQVYDDYMLKFRNQAYLENILDDYQRAQLDDSEVSLVALWNSIFCCCKLYSQFTKNGPHSIFLHKS